MKTGNQNETLESAKVRSLTWALDQALNALQFYKENQVYYYRQGAEWGTECSDLAEETINKIGQMLPKDWRNVK